MDTSQREVSKGLYYLFAGEIISLFSFIPLIGVVVSLVGYAIMVYGLYLLMNQHPDYKNAFIIEIAAMVVSILEAIFSENAFGTFLNFVTIVLSFLLVFFICRGTAAMLDGISTELVARAQLIWKAYLVCTAVLLVAAVLLMIPILNLLGVVLAFIFVIVQLIAGIFFLIFIYKSYKVLQV